MKIITTDLLHVKLENPCVIIESIKLNKTILNEIK